MGKTRSTKKRKTSIQTPGGWTIGGIQGGMDEFFDMTSQSSTSAETTTDKSGLQVDSGVASLLHEVLQNHVEGEVIIMYTQLLLQEEYKNLKDIARYLNVEQMVNMRFKRKYANMIMQRAKKIAGDSSKPARNDDPDMFSSGVYF